MAYLDVRGCDDLRLSLEEIADIPDTVFLEMLQAEGEVVAQAQEERIRETFSQEQTGQLAGSITVTKKLRQTGGSRYLTVYPQGTRVKKETTRRKRKQSRKGKAEGAHDTTNAEVGFINEFGAPRRGIRAAQWMRYANEASADTAVKAAEEVYARWLESKGL